ncbi:MAG: GntR family transcriptional regulator [Eubacteriales bacterium]|nr:GntR family transcriptional regulator [Eubacteriales bacterium]
MAKQSSLKQHIYNEIVDQVFKGDIIVDDVITESSIIERFGVSKSPVREALVELCKEGVLESIPRFGYKLKRYDLEYFQDITFYRSVIEPSFLEKYWDRITDENIQDLIALHEKHLREISPSDAMGYWKSNQEFHLKLASFYHSEFMYDALFASLQKQRILFSQRYWTSWDKTKFVGYTNQHTEFLDALKIRDKHEALKLLRADILSFALR